jgi:uncharacterized membrane protein
MENTFYRLSIVAGVLSGILFGIALALPFGIASEVLSELGNFFATLWLAAIYIFQRDSLPGLGRAGFFALMIGGVILLLQNVLVFFVWEFDYTIIEAQIGTPVWFLILIAGLLYSWAIMALGTASLESGILPRGATILWFVGWLLVMVVPSYVTFGLATVGIIWSGSVMWKGRDPIIDEVVVEEEPKENVEIDNHKPLGRRARLWSLDTIRGLIITLMAIDHASLLVRKAHSFEIFNLPIPNYENAAAFLTRFVTHICAPGFFFLMGAGMVLFSDSRRNRGWSQWRIARHFLIRGLLLIALEQLLLDPVLYRRIIWTEFGVIFGLGGAMIVGILIFRLGSLSLFGVGTGLILFTQVFPTAMIDLNISHLPLVRLFLVPGQTGDWFIIYPILPWLGIAVLGMAFGRELLKDRGRAYWKALVFGLNFLLLFVFVRLFGEFGNFISPAGSSWIDFLNLVKYPPSLGFTLLNLGIVLLLIVLFARLEERLEKWGQPLLVLGGTALFFYFMHWFLLNQFSPLFPEGTSLPTMYLCWALVLGLLYPVCRSFFIFKRNTAPESIWRLF